MPSKVASELIDFDIDRYINPWIPHNRVGYLPAPISRFLGYRKDAYKEPPILVQWFSAFVGAFIGILIVGAIFKYAPGVTNHNPPVIVASLGASAILDYSAIRSPLAQPRNSVLGQGFSAIIGVAIAKLFQLNSDFDNIQWIAGAMACACASLVMCMTNTIHPPGGATAVIACTQANVISMGWWYVPITTLGAVAMLAVALLWNNILRQFPVFWWTPADVGGKLRKAREDESEKDVEKKADRQDSDTSRSVEIFIDGRCFDLLTHHYSQNTLQQQTSNGSTVAGSDDSEQISITATGVHVPSHVRLSPQDMAALEEFQGLLRKARK